MTARKAVLRWSVPTVAALLTAALTLGVAPLAAQASVAGKLSLTPGHSASKVIASKRTSARTVATLTVPASLPVYAAIQFRSPNVKSGYRAKVSISASGWVAASFTRVSGAVETNLGEPKDLGINMPAGRKLRIEAAIAGKSPVRLFVRAWRSGTPTPDWQLATKDSSSSRITKAGKVRLWAFLSTSAPAATKLAYSGVRTRSFNVTKAARLRVLTWSPVNTATPKATSTPTASPTAPTAVTKGKPSASTTGVKAGTSLKRYDGDITVTKDGTVLENLDIHGFVTVRAKGVTIRNSIVRGGKSKGYATGLITNYGYAGLVVSDVDVKAEYPSVYFDGIKGGNFTAQRVHIVGNVDSIKIHGDNVRVENSLLENTAYYASDPQQGGGPTHNDNVQILYGKNLVLTGNTIRGASNFAILGAASKGDTNLTLTNNWLDGGHCTVKLQLLNGFSETAKVTGNVFGPNRKMSTCAFTAYPAVNLNQGGNVFELTNAIVKPLILVS